MKLDSYTACFHNSFKIRMKRGMCFIEWTRNIRQIMIGTFEGKGLSSVDSLLDTNVHIGSFIDSHFIITVVLGVRSSPSLFLDKDTEAKNDFSKGTLFPLQSFWPQDSSSSCSTTLPLIDGNCHDLDFVALKAVSILYLSLVFKWGKPILPHRKGQRISLIITCRGPNLDWIYSSHLGCSCHLTQKMTLVWNEIPIRWKKNQLK